MNNLNIPDPLTARGAVPSKKYTIILRFLLKCLPPRIFVWHKQNLISGSALAQRRFERSGVLPNFLSYQEANTELHRVRLRGC